MCPSSPRIVSQPDFASSPSGPRLLGQIVPELILRIGMRSIDHQLSCGNLQEAKALSETLYGFVPFEREAA